jgi:DNA repair protein SbcD/Mre11
MTFTFIHAADLHLGSPLVGLSSKDPEVARRFAAANRDAFVDLVAQAIEQDVAFVVLAGDLYDGEWKDASIGLFFNRQIARLARANIPVFFIRGNHDAESEVTRAVPLPDSVVEFSTRTAQTKRLEHLRVAIHGRGFADRSMSENLAVTYPAPIPGWFNIGLLHTSCEGHPLHATYAPCSLADLVNRGYDYWALGHVHEHIVHHRDPWIVYPGNLQGRSVRECGPKGAVLVDIADGRVTDVRRLIVDRARWLDISVDVGAAETMDDVRSAVRAALASPLTGAGGRMAAVRVALVGQSALHGLLTSRASELADDIQAIIDHAHDEAWLEALKIKTKEPMLDVASTGQSGLDPVAILTGLEQDADFRNAAAQMIALVKSKLPGSLPTEDIDDLDSIIEEARALSIARATGNGER